MSAAKFCKKLSEIEGATYRLPTRSRVGILRLPAARSGTASCSSFNFRAGRITQPEQHAWYRKNTWDAGEEFAHEVGLKPANAFGLYDMHGNVWEWCQDIWFAKLPGGADPLVSKGPEARYVIRGGSWRSIAEGCRSAERHYSYPEHRYDALGFRVVRVVSEKVATEK